MNFPPPLNPGDTIGIPAPASPFKKELFDQGVDLIKSIGYRVSIPEETYLREGYLAGSDQKRAATLNHMFGDPNIRAIVCARGGYGSMRMLPHLDIDRIRNNPKLVMGFSDLTALLWMLYDRCNLITCHGPTVTTLAAADPTTLKGVAAILKGDHPAALYPDEGVVLRAGASSGPIIGGNLTTLCHLTGTEFAPNFKKSILLLEDRGEAPYRIDRMLSQMRLAGCLDGLSGVLLGTFKDCSDPQAVYRIVTEIIDDPGVPILAGFGIGHAETNIPVPFGVEAFLDTDTQVVRFNSD